MALSIKNKEAEALAHEVAELSRDSITRGVIAALKAYKHHLVRQKSKKHSFQGKYGG